MGRKEQCDLTGLWEQADLRQAMVFSMGNMSVAAQAGMSLSAGWESCSNSRFLKPDASTNNNPETPSDCC